MITLEQCHGCEDDFYNGRASKGARCWSAETGEIVTRFRIGTWTIPAAKGAFTEMRVPSCYRQKGQHYWKAVPHFVKAEDIIKEKRRHG